jgi:GTPase KRas
MRDQNMSCGNGFILLYSITSRQTFDEILFHVTQILRLKDKDGFPMIIVGNHCSLENKREVSTEEGAELARQLGCGFLEVDGKLGTNVDLAFFDLVREIRRYDQGLHSQSRRASKIFDLLTDQTLDGGEGPKRKSWLRRNETALSLKRIVEEQ